MQYVYIHTLDCRGVCICVCVYHAAFEVNQPHGQYLCEQSGSLQQFSLFIFATQPPACAETIFCLSIFPVAHPPRIGKNFLNGFEYVFRLFCAGAEVAKIGHDYINGLGL